MQASSLTPMLTVRDAASAIDFYARAFDAVAQTRVETPTGQIVAEMSIGGEQFFVVDENPEAFNLSPETLGGTSVRMSVIVSDADDAAA
jgi:PhnB protein